GIDGVVASFDPAQFQHASAKRGEPGGVHLSACLTEISNPPYPALGLRIYRQVGCYEADDGNQELSTPDFPHFSLRELERLCGTLRPVCTEAIPGRSCWLQAYLNQTGRMLVGNPSRPKGRSRATQHLDAQRGLHQRPQPSGASVSW